MIYSCLFFGKSFIHPNTYFVSAETLVFQLLTLSHLVNYDEELEWAALCAAHPILNVKGGGAADAV